MKENSIVLWIVRVPGNTSWSTHRSERASHREAAKANRVCRTGHVVYARHENGDVTGPYPDEPQYGESSKE